MSQNQRGLSTYDNLASVLLGAVGVGLALVIALELCQYLQDIAM
jgi:hypothetical protein